MYVVWEGLIAVCDDMKRYAWYLKTRRYEKALALFKTQQRAVDAMWQAMLRGFHAVSVVTYLPAPLGELLRDRLDREVVPCRDFLSTTPAELVRRLPHMSWVLRIADPELPRSRAFGSAGLYVPAEHPEILGTLL